MAGSFRQYLIERSVMIIQVKKIPFIIFVGDEELSSEIYPFKDTASSEEQKLSFERIVSSVKDRRRSHVDDLDDLFE